MIETEKQREEGWKPIKDKINGDKE